MTQAGADSRANYLLKWEAIRSSREAGATTYDLWGLAHAGHRPLQDRLRRPRDPVRRARGTSCWTALGRRTYARGPARPGPRGAHAPRPARAGRARRPRATGATPGATGEPLRPRRELGPSELGGWDAAAVDAPGGHVFQSRAWAEHRAPAGWRRRYLVAGDVRALVLGRPWPTGGGGSAYVPRGPVARRHAVGRGRRGRAAGRHGDRRGARGDRRAPGARRRGRAGGRPRGPADDAAYRPDPRRCRLPRRSPRSSPRATGWRWPSRPAATRRRSWTASPRPPASGSAVPSATGSSSCAGTRPPGDAEGFVRATEDGRRRPGPVLRAAARHRRPARLRVRGSRRVHGLVAPRPGRRPPRLPRGARGRRGRRRAGRPRPVPPRDAAVHRPLRRPGGAPARPPGRDAPAALARDPAGPGRGPHRDGPRRRGRGGRPAGPGARASPRTGCTSTSGRSGPSGWRSPARRSAWHGRGATPPAGRPRS